MKSIVHLDKSGRIVIPQQIRDKLLLVPGCALSLDLNDGVLTLRSAKPSLMQERGIWVFRSGAKLSAARTTKAVRAVRKQRALSASRKQINRALG